MALSDLIPHPRRLGFVAFNLIALVLVVSWFFTRRESAEAGLPGFPNLVLSTVGIVIVFAVWIGAWIAWAVMVWRRHRHHPQA